MNKQVNVLNHITTVLQTKLPISHIGVEEQDYEYLLRIYPINGVPFTHYISLYDLECLERDVEIYYYTKVVIHTVSQLLQNAHKPE